MKTGIHTSHSCEKMLSKETNLENSGSDPIKNIAVESRKSGNVPRVLGQNAPAWTCP